MHPTLSDFVKRYRKERLRMRITLESDYALRIVTAIAESDGVVDAGTLSEKTLVTQRFTLKILHKLVLGGLILSYKGAKGGYKLAKSA